MIHCSLLPLDKKNMLRCQCITSVLPVYYQCVTSVLPVCYQCVASVMPVYYQCIASVLPDKVKVKVTDKKSNGMLPPIHNILLAIVHTQQISK